MTFSEVIGGEKKWIPCVPFAGGSASTESTCKAGDLGSIPGLGRSPGEGKGCPRRCSGLENSMDYSPWGRKASNMTEQLSCVPDPEIVLKRPCLKAECRKEQSDVLWGEEGTSRWLVCIHHTSWRAVIGSDLV